MARGQRDSQRALRMPWEPRTAKLAPKPIMPQELQPPLRTTQPRQQLVDIGDGRQLSVRRWGGRGTPLVVLHGLLDSAESFDRLAQSTRRPVLAIDLPGFGHSDQPRQASIASFADDVARCLRRLRLKQFHVVGHSMGGAVGVALAEEMGERVASLTLVTPAGFGALHTADLFALPLLRQNAGRAIGELARHRHLVALAYVANVSHRRMPDQEMLDHLTDAMGRGARGLGAAVEALAHSGHDRDAFFRRPIAYDGPVRALWGAQDHVVPAWHIDGFRRAFPKAEVQCWSELGHHPQFEMPDELAAFVETSAHQAES